MKFLKGARGSLGAVLAVFALSGASGALADSKPTITDIVASSGGEFDRNRHDYDILLTAVVTAGLDGALANPEAHLTVFAPNDRAFIRLARDLGFKGRDEAGAWAFLVAALTELGDGNPIPVLTNVLLYHVAPAKLDVFDFFIAAIFRKEIPTLLPGATVDPFLFGLRDNEPDLKDPRLTRPINVRASNGIIHTLNRVLLPIDLP